MIYNVGLLEVGEAVNKSATIIVSHLHKVGRPRTDEMIFRRKTFVTTRAWLWCVLHARSMMTSTVDKKEQSLEETMKSEKNY